MGQALYRKYRSKSLDEIVGQDHITTTLRNALNKGVISHAYLFTGPRGVGKTSIARILAHEVNKLAYNEEVGHLDIIEIDAASNRRIEEIRDLRDKVHVAPTSAAYKVYIIDEVHMLTKEAFNALLKTLEEPPAHVIFILATTEVHKVPETIVSRTQRFTFKPIETEQAIKHLQAIAKAEHITISPEALALLAEHGKGSFRDSINLLDQVRAHHAKVELTDVEAMLGIAPHSAIEQLLALLTDQPSPKQIHEFLIKLYDQGITPAQIAKQLQILLKQALVNNASPLDITEATDLMRALLSVPAAPAPDDALLIALLELAKQPTSPEAQPVKSVESSARTKPANNTPKTTPAAPKLVITKHELADFDAVWQQSLSVVKQQYNTLYGILRMAQPELDGTTLTLKFAFPFHQKRLEEAKNQQILIDIIAKQTGQTITLQCRLDKKASAKPVLSEAEELVREPVASNTTLQAISDIFGEAEVLES